MRFITSKILAVFFLLTSPAWADTQTLTATAQGAWTDWVEGAGGEERRVG